MTTDPTPDWEQLLDKLDRIIEVLEDIRDARRGQNTQKPPTPEEIVKFARGGIVRRPEGAEPVAITYDPERDGPVITAEQVRQMGIPTLDELREQVLQRVAGRDLNAAEAREAEEAGLLVVECTAASDPEPVFWADRPARDADEKTNP